MPFQSWVGVLITAQGDGSALTAASAASALPASAKYTLPANFVQYVGQSFRVTAHGRISCAVTTPGTARYDLRFGASAVSDTGAMNLNIVAKTNVPWFLDMLLTARVIGSTGNFMQLTKWASEAYIASPTTAAGGNGLCVGPVSAGASTAPVVGANADLTVSNVVDFFFTQTVATGSMTLHQYILESLN